MTHHFVNITSCHLTGGGGRFECTSQAESRVTKVELVWEVINLQFHIVRVVILYKSMLVPIKKWVSIYISLHIITVHDVRTPPRSPNQSEIIKCARNVESAFSFHKWCLSQ